jgi:hypothetical protein
MGATWSTGVWAGFVASILAACVFWLFRSFNATRFSPTTQLGCLVSREPDLPMTETVGFLLYLACGAVFIPPLYRAFMGALGGSTWAAGVVAGLLHGVLTAALLPWLARVDPCVRSGRVPPPGRFGLRWGTATPVAVVAGHMVYGGILGAVLASF